MDPKLVTQVKNVMTANLDQEWSAVVDILESFPSGALKRWIVLGEVAQGRARLPAGEKEQAVVAGLARLAMSEGFFRMIQRWEAKIDDQD